MNTKRTNRTNQHPVLTFLLASILVTFGLASAQDIHDVVSDVAQAWVDTFNVGDAAGLAAMYTTDAKFMPSDGSISVGRDAIQAWAQRVYDAGARFVANPVEAEQVGDVAYADGAWAALTPEARMLTAGQFFLVYKLVDGEWLIHRHFARLPPPAE